MKRIGAGKSYGTIEQTNEFLRWATDYQTGNKFCRWLFF
jgi:hypothetical protein